MIRGLISSAVVLVSATAASAAEVNADFFGPSATVQSFEEAGPAFGGPISLGGNTYAGSPFTSWFSFFACHAGRCVGNNQDGQAFSVSLGQPVSAAGAYVGGFSDAWSIRADFFDADDILLGSVSRQGSGFTPLFAGFQSTARAVARVAFVDVASSDFRVIVIDDFSTVAAAAVPEPATWAMMIGGFAMLGAAARRRTHTSTTYA